MRHPKIEVCTESPLWRLLPGERYCAANRAAPVVAAAQGQLTFKRRVFTLTCESAYRFGKLAKERCQCIAAVPNFGCSGSAFRCQCRPEGPDADAVSTTRFGETKRAALDRHDIDFVHVAHHAGSVFGCL